MKPINELAHDNPSWSLGEFVQIVNQYLPHYLPTESANTKVRDQVTSRLIRHYTTQSMIDEPHKAGREARYAYRHLLQILVVRRLLVDGYGSGVIGNLATAKGDHELESLLQGGFQVQLTVANPALNFLHQIQERESIASAPSSLGVAQQIEKEQPPAAKEQWFRIRLIRGLELHIRSDFVSPKSEHERQNLVQLFLRALKTFTD